MRIDIICAIISSVGVLLWAINNLFFYWVKMTLNGSFVNLTLFEYAFNGLEPAIGPFLQHAGDPVQLHDYVSGLPSGTNKTDILFIYGVSLFMWVALAVTVFLTLIAFSQVTPSPLYSVRIKKARKKATFYLSCVIVSTLALVSYFSTVTIRTKSYDATVEFPNLLYLLASSACFFISFVLSVLEERTLKTQRKEKAAALLKESQKIKVSVIAPPSPIAANQLPGRVSQSYLPTALVPVDAGKMNDGKGAADAGKSNDESSVKNRGNEVVSESVHFEVPPTMPHMTSIVVDVLSTPVLTAATPPEEPALPIRADSNVAFVKEFPVSVHESSVFTPARAGEEHMYPQTTPPRFMKSNKKKEKKDAKEEERREKERKEAEEREAVKKEEERKEEERREEERRMDFERREAERKEFERREVERREDERRETERRDRERRDQEKRDQERREQERRNQEAKENEMREAQRREQEAREREWRDEERRKREVEEAATKDNYLSGRIVTLGDKHITPPPIPVPIVSTVPYKNSSLQNSFQEMTASGRVISRLNNLKHSGLAGADGIEYPPPLIPAPPEEFIAMHEQMTKMQAPLNLSRRDSGTEYPPPMPVTYHDADESKQTDVNSNGLSPPSLGDIKVNYQRTELGGVKIEKRKKKK